MENMSSQFYHLLFSIELTLSIPVRNNLKKKKALSGQKTRPLARDHESCIILDF